jgi:hypothetical protein
MKKSKPSQHIYTAFNEKVRYLARLNETEAEDLTHRFSERPQRWKISE